MALQYSNKSDNIQEAAHALRVSQQLTSHILNKVAEKNMEKQIS